MAWLDEMRPATFRGVVFHVDTGERTSGRAVVVHEFPFSEAPPYTEDLGLKGRTFSVEGHIVGDDYLEQLSKLLDALEQPGTGVLNHPYFGVRTVALSAPARVRQSSREGGMATIAMEFAESSAKPSAPVATVDAGATAAAAVDGVKATTAQAFVASAVGLTDAAVPTFGAVRGLVGQCGASLRSALSKAAVAPAAFAAFTRELTAPVVTVTQFARAAEYFPAYVDSLFASATRALTAADSRVIDPVPVLLGLSDVIVLPADASDEAIANYEAVRVMVQRYALASSATALLARNFTGFEDAVRARRQVIDAVDAHTATSIDDTYSAFVDLRVAVATAVPGVDSSLPRLQLYTPPTTVPSLVLAHRLYGDVSRESELLDRNTVRHPAFVPGGRALEVLTRV